MEQNRKEIVLKQTFASFNKGDRLIVIDDDTAQVYKVADTSSLLYVPKILCEDVEETTVSGDSNETVGNTSSNDGEEGNSKTLKSLLKEAAAEEDTELLIGGSRVTIPAAVAPDVGSHEAETPEQKEKREKQEALLAEKAEKERKVQALLAALNARRECLKPIESPLLKEGQFWLSDLTNGKLPESGVDHIITTHNISNWVKDDEGKWYIKHDAEHIWYNHSMASSDIPEMDMTYFWNPDVIEVLCVAYMLKEKALLTGPPGTGKTTAVKQFAAWTDHPYMRFNGKDGIEQSSFLGFNNISGGTMEWQDGLLPQGLKMGYIICLDEIFKIPAGIQMALQSLYEKDGALMLDDKAGTMYDKLVVPHDLARLYLTDNVKGTGDATEMFAATQAQDTSTLDRFGLTAEVDYLSREDEMEMLQQKYPDVQYAAISRLVKVANLIRTAYKDGSMSLTMSPRGLMVACDMMREAGLSEQVALRYSFINKLSDDVELQALKQMLEAVY